MAEACKHPGQGTPIAAQAAKLEGILQSAVTAIITIDERGLIENINPATERLFGYGAEDLIGRNVKLLMPEPYRREHDRYIGNYLATGTKKIIGIGREVSDVLFTDLVMPGGLSGRDVAAKAKALRPGIRVLLTSGYAEELVQGGDSAERNQPRCCASPIGRPISPWRCAPSWAS